MNDLLITIENILSSMTVFETVSIGAERGISAKDTPAARIVQEYFSPEPNQFFYEGELQVVILLDIKNGARDMNLATNTIALEIIKELSGVVKFKRALHDQDSVTVFKSAILIFSFSGIRNSRVECEYL